MKKYELENTIEDKNQSFDVVDRLTQHVSNLWLEICQKHEKVTELKWEVSKLERENKELVNKCKSLIEEKYKNQIDKAEVEKDLNDFLNIQRTDN